MKPSSSIVVASYDRPASLARCLAGIRAQTHAPDDVIVVARSADVGTADLVAEHQATWPRLRLVHVLRPGLVAALNRGAAAAGREIVAFVDDDAIPRRDWLARIATTFDADARIAAVGGKDVVHLGGQIITGRPGAFLPVWPPGRSPTVGHLQWFGRMTANHHAGTGPPRDVHVIKGVNMAYRRSLLTRHGFDERLHGGGSQVHNEATACLPLIRSGYRVVYDPAILVDHYAAPRPVGDERGRLDLELIRHMTHNYVLGLLDHLSPPRRCVLVAWILAVGTGSAPGLANACRIWLTRGPQPWARMRATQEGAWRAACTRRTVLRPPFEQARAEDLSDPHAASR